MGRGRIDGRPVVVGGDDFTVRGGAADASIFQKQVHAERMAHDLGLPIVRLVDGSGGGGSVKTLETERRAFVPFNPGLGVGRREPRAGCRSSACASARSPGLGAARVVTSHYSMMVKGTSHLFVAGPVVVNQLGTETVDKETLGGSGIHTRNGAVDDEVATEEEAFARARAVPLVPAELGRRAAAARRGRPTTRSGATPSLIDAIPRERRKVYKVRSIIEAVVDRGLVPRDRPRLGPLRGHRARAARRLAGRGARQRPVPLRRRLDRRRVAQGRALRRPRRDVPAPGRAPRRQPGLPHRHRGGAGGRRSATAPARSPRSTRRRCRGAR